ncbi:NAD-dependent epimerase/dehydratase family protein [Candidatus Binatus sp.]|uniref:NAD-dependent epimerase/dehydratase family protein n=1 Tax=Candidatus Binatus sp. TaxID=2811406 RepID=UPI003C8B3ED6
MARRSTINALVIGASGHIGNAIVRAFLDRNYRVSACSRRSTSPANLSELPVRYLSGDIETPGQLDKWIAGHDLVVDAAAPYPLNVFSLLTEAGKDPISHAERRTRLMLDALRRHKARLVYVGSFVTGVRPRTSAQRFQHQAMRLAHPYFEIKELIESQILDASRRGIQVIIANPTYCLGPWDLHDRRLCTIPLLLSGEIPSSIGQTLNVIDVRDVAAAICAAIEGERYGEPIQMSGHDISTGELYSLICKIGGVPSPRMSTPTTVALAGAYAMELVLGTIGEKTLLPAGGMMMATLFDYLVSGNELQQLGITPRPLTETLVDAIKWYRQIGYC